MKAVIYLFNSVWGMLDDIPLFDTGIDFGTFLLALILFDVFLIILRKVLRNRSQDSNKSPSTKGSES